MCAICSNLVDPEGVNALVVLELDPSWKHILSSKWVPLPTLGEYLSKIGVHDQTHTPP